MGSKGSQTTQQTAQNQQYTADPRIQQAGSQALGAAESAAAQPFQMPQAPVAGFSPLQKQAFQQYQGLQNSWQPYFQQGASYTADSAAPIRNVSDYYNPMADSVTAQLKNIFGEQNAQNTGSLTNTAGGVGADRIAVGQADVANQQTLAAGQTYANLYQQALQAAEQQKQLEAGAGAQFQAFGTGTLSNNLQQTGALLTAGGLQQQQRQAQLNAPYQQRLAQIAYPFQTAQYLAGITGGLAPAFGGATNQMGNQITTPPTASLLNQITGVGTAGVGLYNAFGGNNGSIQSDPNLGLYSTGTSAAADATQDNLQDLGFARGGVPNLASGGQDDSGEVIPGVSNPQDLSPIPYIPLHGGAGHSGLTTGALPTPPSAPQSQSQGDSIGSDIAGVAKLATTVLPFLALKRGGPAGYDDGGDVNSPDSPNFDPSRPIEGVEAPLQGVWPFNHGHTEMGGNGEIVPNKSAWDVITGPWGVQGQAPNVTPAMVESAKDRMRKGWGIQAPDSIPGGEPPPVNPNQPYRMPNPAAVQAWRAGADADKKAGMVHKQSDDDDDDTPSSAPPPNIQPYPSTVRQSQMPDSYAPYPDALKRDWGQNLARSPWLSLIQAGATIASTPGPLGSAIGKGLLAGTKSLDDQRKELRSEQELNDKAQELYEKAKEHLDKYNNMTPYERGSLAARNKELDQEASGISGKPGKFTGADYDRAARFVQSMNPGLSPEQLQPLIDAEVARRRHALMLQTSAAPQAGVVPPAGTEQTFSDGKGGNVVGVADGKGGWGPKQ